MVYSGITARFRFMKVPTERLLGGGGSICLVMDTVSRIFWKCQFKKRWRTDLYARSQVNDTSSYVCDIVRIR